MEAEKMGSNAEEKTSFQNQKGKRSRSYRLAGLLRLSEDGEATKDGEEAVEGTSQFCTSLDEERESSSSPVQSPSSTGTTCLNPAPTITAWEAGWNVTNAIQVRTTPRFSLEFDFLTS